MRSNASPPDRTTPVKLAPLLILVAVLSACAQASSRLDRWPLAMDDREVEVLVRYAPRDEAVARQVRRVLRAAIPQAERWAKLSAPITITIHPTHRALEAAAHRPDHPWLRAWARPEGIELQSPRTWSRGEATDGELAQLLAHELTHCVMYQAVGGDVRVARTIPVWFREGMATWSAGESFAAVPPVPGERGALAVTALAYQADSSRVYATADRAFRLLVRAHGEDSVRALLASLREGHEFDHAFERAVGLSVQEFESEFATSVPRESSQG
jgi:hypothetical protein